MKRVSITVGDDTYEYIQKLRGMALTETGKNITFSKIIDHLTKIGITKINNDEKKKRKLIEEILE